MLSKTAMTETEPVHTHLQEIVGNLELLGPPKIHLIVWQSLRVPSLVKSKICLIL
jgi:hypothetical protein